jgi:hypothetical protein
MMNQGEWEPRIFVAGAKTGRPPNRPVGDSELRQVFGRFGTITKIKTGTVYSITESTNSEFKDYPNTVFGASDLLGIFTMT